MNGLAFPNQISWDYLNNIDLTGIPPEDFIIIISDDGKYITTIATVDPHEPLLDVFAIQIYDVDDEKIYVIKDFGS